jgi:hypothetical protein
LCASCLPIADWFASEINAVVEGRDDEFHDLDVDRLAVPERGDRPFDRLDLVS